MESFIQDPEGVFFVVWFYLGPLPLAMGTVAGKIRSAEASQRGIAALSHGLQEHEACVIVAIGLEKDKRVVESVRCLQQPKRVISDDWPSFSLQPLRLFSSSSISPSILHDALE